MLNLKQRVVRDLMDPGNLREEQVVETYILPKSNPHNAIVRILRWRYRVSVGLLSIFHPGGWGYCAYLVVPVNDAGVPGVPVDALRGLPWPGGVTYEEFDDYKGKKALVIGCDFQHSFDSPIFSFEDILPSIASVVEGYVSLVEGVNDATPV